MKQHIDQLKFRKSILLSAQLGKDNKGTHYNHTPLISKLMLVAKPASETPKKATALTISNGNYLVVPFLKLHRNIHRTKSLILRIALTNFYQFIKII